MPGLVGFTFDPQNCPEASEAHESQVVLRRMRDSIVHREESVLDELVIAERVAATRVHIDVIQKQPQPCISDGVSVWIDGEFNNRDELARRKKLNVSSDAELLLALIAQDDSYASLGEIDGFYAAVILDARRQRLRMISDRYGLRHLYWTVINGQLTWSSEVKAFLEHPAMTPVIDQTALKQFMSIGCLLNDRTWFRDVHLLDSGTVLEWNLFRGEFVKQHQYWSWGCIPQRSEHEITDDLIDELGHLFRRAVERRCHPAERIGLTLSGGLDSRAILATIPEEFDPIPAITFGEANCQDARIARLAAAQRGAHHHVVDIGGDNWLQDRIAGVWWTDGHLDLQHMHGIEARHHMRRHLDISLNGYAGDLILGGSYLPEQPVEASQQKAFTARFMGCDESALEGWDQVQGHPSTDIYFLQHRVRRFTYYGTQHCLNSFALRKPFYDNDVIDFAYGLPDDLRRGGNLYHAMLLRFLPEYFEHIPYQAWGVPISASTGGRWRARFLRRVTHRLNRSLGKLGPQIGSPLQYSNYANWLRHESASSFIHDTLGSKTALYGEYLSVDATLDALQRHLRGENHTDLICRSLTLEIWLQQVYAGRFRDFDSPFTCEESTRRAA
ncbi:MAG: hypothetical protein IIB54_02195 [Planctomycetes bacterium]|nr:hypothetical protein [Planctomycetota bacterium]